MKNKLTISFKSYQMDKSSYEQFVFERMLAQKLFHTTADERRAAYKSIYGQYFERYPTVSFDPKSNIKHKIEWQICLLRPLLKEDAVFMEIGAGNCLLSMEVAKYVKQVISYEVADSIPHIDNKPNNLVVKIFDGIDFCELDNSIDVIYSNQVFEHLHVNDTEHHLDQYAHMLKKNGHIVIVTPHSATGPHDISRNFSIKPEGFHMKEYSYRELKEMLIRAHFKKIKASVGNKKMGYISLNCSVLIFLERIYCLIPLYIRYRLKENRFLLSIFGIKITASK